MAEASSLPEATRQLTLLGSPIPKPTSENLNKAQHQNSQAALIVISSLASISGVLINARPFVAAHDQSILQPHLSVSTCFA
ncbi:hypothetical protein [Zavarzinella formosa]|uniref:hypothetical protein n=1 Tax=Zavarzinella formosa TaxID=360055 RepID=UPI0012FB83EE|nr:hypothetical protein [Zavarzinella formosa]